MESAFAVYNKRQPKAKKHKRNDNEAEPNPKKTKINNTKQNQGGKNITKQPSHKSPKQIETNTKPKKQFSNNSKPSLQNQTTRKSKKKMSSDPEVSLQFQAMKTSKDHQISTITKPVKGITKETKPLKEIVAFRQHQHEGNKHLNGKSKKKKKLSNGCAEEEIPELIECPIEASTMVDFFDNDDYTSKGTSLLKWLLYPVTPANFFENYWETGPLHINRKKNDYYKDILTTSDIDVMLREHPLHFGRNVDIVTYKDGKRVTENPSGRAKASIVWNAYSEGYSVRILNPHTYNHKIHLILATLQEYFGAMVGVNVYLTPAGSQGFAPHYDDIEAFVIQLEGRKHWKLYKPKDQSDNLARFSSKDFNREDLGELMAEVTLNAGNILYFPRGVIHEAKTDDELHSLHITISTYQRTSFVDLLEKALPDALNKAAADDIEFRKGLPFNYLKHLGIANCDVNTSERALMIQKSKDLIAKLCNYVSLDDAADQLGRKFMHDALPPVPSLDEQQRTSRLDGERLYEGNLVNRSEIDPDTKVRLIRYYAIRLVREENECRVYFCTENAKVYHGEEEQFITIDNDMCPVIQTLLKTYPSYVKVENLPHDDITKKISLVTELWDYGIIVTENPLEIISDPLEDTDSSDYDDDDDDDDDKESEER